MYIILIWYLWWHRYQLIPVSNRGT